MTEGEYVPRFVKYRPWKGDGYDAGAPSELEPVSDTPKTLEPTP